jgi:hypothetical protein
MLKVIVAEDYCSQRLLNLIRVYETMYISFE